MYRILIAEDEKTVRDGVASFLSRNCLDFEVAGTAADGEEALQKARLLLPEVIITDIAMPKMNGLDFLEHITHLLPDTRLVVLSGYDRFEYAREALRLGVKQYLLKPLDTKQLLTLLAQFKTELDAEKRRWRQLGKLSEAENSFIAGRPMGIGGTAAAVGPAAEPPAESAAIFREAILSGTGSDEAGYLYFCALGRGEGDCWLLREALKDRFRQDISVECFRVGTEKHVMVFCFPDQTAAGAFLKINIGLTSIANHFRLEGLGHFHFFIGGTVDSVRRLSISYEQAMAAAEYGFLDQTDTVSNYMDCVSGQMTECLYPPDNYLKEMTLQVNYGSAEAFGEQAGQLLGWFEEQKIYNACFIKMCLRSIVFRLFSAAQNVSANALEVQRFDEELEKAAKFAKLQQILWQAGEFLIARRNQELQKSRELSAEVDFMIRENMGDPDFSLDDVAARLYISPNYLRQLFKKETGITFVEYLTKARLEQARILLDTQQILVSAVAVQVGYKDPRYFSACFKKMFQISPSELLEQKQ